MVVLLVSLISSGLCNTLSSLASFFNTFAFFLTLLPRRTKSIPPHLRAKAL